MLGSFGVWGNRKERWGHTGAGLAVSQGGKCQRCPVATAVGSRSDSLRPPTADLGRHRTDPVRDSEGGEPLASVSVGLGGGRW